MVELYVIPSKTINREPGGTCISNEAISDVAVGVGVLVGVGVDVGVLVSVAVGVGVETGG